MKILLFKILFKNNMTSIPSSHPVLLDANPYSDIDVVAKGWSGVELVLNGLSFIENIVYSKKVGDEIRNQLRIVSSSIKYGHIVEVRLGFYHNAKFAGKWLKEYDENNNVILDQKSITGDNVNFNTYLLRGPQLDDVIGLKLESIKGFDNSMLIEVKNLSAGYRTFYYSYYNTDGKLIRNSISAIKPQDVRKQSIFSKVKQLKLYNTAVGNNSYTPEVYIK